jgi:hypothetical protein
MKKLGLVFLSLILLAGCNSAPNAPQEKPQPKPPDLLTARTAFQQLFVSARGWAPDAKPYQLQSQPTSDSNGHDGKSTLWRAAFASTSQSASRSYMWSGVESQDTARGVTPGTQDSFLPGNAFDVAFLKIDSDKAFEIAQKHGGEKILQDAATTPVSYLLDWNRGENDLVWHVIYGTGRNDAKLVADINASTGEFIRKEK